MNVLEPHHTKWLLGEIMFGLKGHFVIR